MKIMATVIAVNMMIIIIITVATPPQSTDNHIYTHTKSHISLTVTEQYLPAFEWARAASNFK